MLILFPLISIFIGNGWSDPGPGNGTERRCIFFQSSALPQNWLVLAKQIREKVHWEDRNSMKANIPTPVRCSMPDKHVCIAFYKNFGDNQTEAILQGCLDLNDCIEDDYCVSTSIINDEKVKGPNSTEDTQHLCCCRNTECNTEENLLYIPKSTSELVPVAVSPEPLSTRAWVLISLLSLTFILTLSLFAVLIYRKKRLQKQEQNGENECLIEMEKMKLFYNSPNVNQFILGDLLGRGHFANVFKAKLPDVPGELPITVAVKVFFPHGEAHYRAEVLNWKHLLAVDPHPNILGYKMAGECRTVDGFKEFRIITDFCVGGSLQEHLKKNPIQWRAFYGFACSITSALAFLHAESFGNATTKQSIAHRDVNTVNVLVRDPFKGVAVLGDFGLAVSFPHAIDKEDIQITEIGTTRYMAPELLEGSLNLLDPMSALRQADIYACGLVLWEMLYRCEGAYNGEEVPPYRSPYQEHTGSPPNMAQMLDVVVRRGIRPEFPKEYKSKPGDWNNPFCRLCSAIEDCWEREPEGRATIACTSERFRQLRRELGYE